jgi:hypothetical protein
MYLAECTEGYKSGAVRVQCSAGAWLCVSAESVPNLARGHELERVALVERVGVELVRRVVSLRLHLLVVCVRAEVLLEDASGHLVHLRIQTLI